MVEEKLGKPTVPIVTQVFETLAKTNALRRGMPNLRTTFVPHPVWGKTAEQLRSDIAGKDPVRGEPIMQEIVDGLTKALNDEEKKSGVIEPSAGPPMYGPDTPENLQQLFLENGMTDYLPIVLPTEEKVAEMLKGTSHRPDETVGKMSPAAGAYVPWSYTVKQVAVNAVMAGAKPEYFPVILALAATGSTSLSSSTNSFSRAVVINGPIRDQIGLNYGIGAMGPFGQANATIGRAYTLLSKNLGTSGIAGETYLGALGNATSYANIIIAENEAESPWQPFHVQKGFKPEESVVSIFMGYGIISAQGAAAGATVNEPHFDRQLRDLFGGLAPLFGGFAVLDPTVAKHLKEEGYDTKEKLINWLRTNPEGGRPLFRSPSDIALIVTGGQTNLYYHYGGMRYEKSVSIDAWR